MWVVYDFFVPFRSIQEFKRGILNDFQFEGEDVKRHKYVMVEGVTICYVKKGGKIHNFASKRFLSNHRFFILCVIEMFSRKSV